MCCEMCPRYEDCAAKDQLKEICCRLCPDYKDCYSIDEEEENEDSGY